MALQKTLTRARDYLFSRPDVQKLITNTGWLFFESVFRLVISVLVGAWVARYLGTEQFGKLNLAVAYLAILTPIVRLGLDSIVVQRIVNEGEDNPKQTGVILGTAFALRLFTSLLLAIPLLFIVYSLNDGDLLLTALSALLAFGLVFQSLEVVTFWFRSQVNAKSTVIGHNISLTIVSLLKVLAILTNAPLMMFGVLYALDVILYMLFIWLIYQRHQRKYVTTPPRWSFNASYAWGMLRQSAPLILAGLAVSVYMRIDQIMLSQLLPKGVAESAVGVYSVAVRISEMWYFIPGALVVSTFPALLKSKKENEELYRKRLQRLFNLVVLVAYSVALPMTFLAGVIVDVLYGAEYAESVLPLIILTWAGVWVSLGLVRSQVYIAEGVASYSMWATVAGALVNVILNFWLIPPLGALGCAIATLISQVIAAHLSTFFTSKTRFIALMQTKSVIYPNPF